MQMVTNKEDIKSIIKEVILEVLSERQDILIHAVQEALEDFYLGKAMEEAIDSEEVSEEEALAALHQVD